MSSFMLSFVYIGIQRKTENNQIALIIIQHIWNSHFLRLLFIFDTAIFSTKFAHHSFEVVLNVVCMYCIVSAIILAQILR